MVFADPLYFLTTLYKEYQDDLTIYYRTLNYSSDADSQQDRQKSDPSILNSIQHSRSACKAEGYNLETQSQMGM